MPPATLSFSMLSQAVLGVVSQLRHAGLGVDFMALAIDRPAFRFADILAEQRDALSDAVNGHFQTRFCPLALAKTRTMYLWLLLSDPVQPLELAFTSNGIQVDAFGYDIDSFLLSLLQR